MAGSSIRAFFKFDLATATTADSWSNVCKSLWSSACKSHVEVAVGEKDGTAGRHAGTDTSKQQPIAGRYAPALLQIGECP